MALHFLYRKNGGEVVGLSVDSGVYADVDATYFGVQIDPSTPDGTDLAVKKIRVTTTVRNATSGEIAAFVTAEDTDNNLINRQAAKDAVDGNSIVTRKAYRSLVKVLVDEINDLRGWLADFKVEVAASTNLANLQSRVAGLPNMPDRTLSQAKTAILNEIDSGSQD